MKLNKIGKLFSLLFVAFMAATAFYFARPAKLDSATLTSASATLSNSRLSYHAGIGVTAPAGQSVVHIDTDGADDDTNHLFPSDSICFTNPVNSGCIGYTDYSVARIEDSDTFVIDSALSVGVSATDYVVATSSGVLTVQFTLTNQIPAGGDILLTIPAVNTTGRTDDGIPDTAASTSSNGFDINNITTGEVTFAGGTGCSWTTTSVTAGDASNDHRILGTTSATCTAGVVTITVGDSGAADTMLVNPAPISSGHTQGVADTYAVSLTTRDSGDIQIDTADIVIAPVEAVLISATVDETLEFTVAGKAVGTTACGITTDKATQAYAVPWGTIAATDTFYDAAQQLTVTTNADGGYAVTIEENDQMGRNGGACSGAAADEDDNCIKDTLCGGTPCTEAAARDWTTAGTYHGLGYSLEDVDGTDAIFDYDGKPAETTCTTGTFCARQIADQEATETKATIMTNSNPVNSKDIYVCYRIAISGTQPAGYYYNKVKYTATATF